HVFTLFSRIAQPSLSYHTGHPPPHRKGSLEIALAEQLGHLSGGNAEPKWNLPRSGCG
ncbi:hypothetical protein B0T20DRAFT_358988, partial [Sordaria brevicollis]